MILGMVQNGNTIGDDLEKFGIIAYHLERLGDFISRFVTLLVGVGVIGTLGSGEDLLSFDFFSGFLFVPLFLPGEWATNRPRVNS